MRNGERTFAELLGIGGHEHPITNRIERCALVSDTYGRAGVGIFCDPLLLAVAAGLQIRPIVPGERLAGNRSSGCLYYDWDPDPRVLGGEVFRRLAATLLGRKTHNGTDEHLLAAELAIPEICARTMRVTELIAEQRHAPIRWIEARVASLTPGSGVFGKPPELAG